MRPRSRLMCSRSWREGPFRERIRSPGVSLLQISVSERDSHSAFHTETDVTKSIGSGVAPAWRNHDRAWGLGVCGVGSVT
jgi:hypothetical protein